MKEESEYMLLKIMTEILKEMKAINKNLETINETIEDVGFIDFQVQVRGVVADGGLPAQPDHPDALSEFCLETGNDFTGIGGGVVEAVFVVHVQHEN